MRASVLVPLAIVLAIPAACERKAIPARGGAGAAADPEPGASNPSDPPGGDPADPVVLLEGGRLVFEDDFEREVLGERWTTSHAGWVIAAGALRSTAPENEGVWLDLPLPDRVRIEFSARSDRLPDGKPFPGDLKCEVFAEKPEHATGYVVIHGGWTNTLDVIARLDEHGKDRKEAPATPVEPGRTYRWAIARSGSTLHWFRDGALVMSYVDPAPLRGRYFGFNNWRTNATFDDLRVFALP